MASPLPIADRGGTSGEALCNNGNATSDKGKPVARRGRKANGSSAMRGTAGPPELHRLADGTGKTGGS